MKIKKEKGFTLVEILIVIAIITVIAAIAVPSALSGIESAKESAIVANIKQLEDGCAIYNVKEEKWPLGATMGGPGIGAGKLYSKSGQIESLPAGEYYGINYEGLSSIVSKPKEEEKYVLQSPEGKVFFIKELGGTGGAGTGEDSELGAKEPTETEEEKAEREEREAEEKRKEEEVKRKEQEEKDKKDFLFGSLSITKNTINDYAGEGGDVVIPEKIGETEVKFIGTGAFNRKGKPSLTSVVIPNSVKTVYGGAFNDNPDLAKITIGEGVNFIADGTDRQFHVFYNTTGRKAGTYVYEGEVKKGTWVKQ